MSDWFIWIMGALGLGFFGWAAIRDWTGAEEPTPDEDLVSLGDCPVGLFTCEVGEDLVFGLKTTTRDLAGRTNCYDVSLGKQIFLADVTLVRPITEDEVTDFIDNLW